MFAQKRLIGSVAWVLSLQFYVIQVVCAAAWERTGFSWTNNTISDLGNTVCGTYGDRLVCSPQHAIMNASFIALGITMITGAILLATIYGNSRWSLVGFSCMVLSGIGTIVVGLYPENAIGSAHTMGAALALIFGNVGMIALGASTTFLPRVLRLYAAASGIFGLIGLALFMSHVYLGLGIGGMERVAAYPQSIFMIVIGCYLLLRQPK